MSIATLVPTFRHLAYQVYFSQNTTAAIGELNEDVRRTLRSTLRTANNPPPKAFLTSTTDFFGAFDRDLDLPPIAFLTPDEEDYMVEQYSIQKFDKSSAVSLPLSY
jgi:soluble epoxide hydrolase / lipid-phosphate phosphatase